MKKILLLVNPFSGRGVSKQKLGDIVDRFAKSGCSVNVCYTSPEHSASSLASSYGADYDIVVCVGGDGTLSGVVAGLLTLGEPPLVGYIPTGTANDVAYTLSLPRTVSAAVDTILTGEPVEMDAGKFCGEIFTYIAAFGAFAATSYQTTQSAKRALGYLAYILGGLADLSQIKPYNVKIEYDGGVIEDEFIMGGITNSTSVAGLVRLKPSLVDLSDGMFEVFLIRNPVNLAQFGEIVRDFTQSDFTSDYVVLLRTSKIVFHFDEPVKWTRDGEPGGNYQHAEIVNIPRAVRLIHPKPPAEVSVPAI